MTAPVVPPGWPEPVRPPQSTGWQRSAIGWLLDLCPADYRAHPVLTRHPHTLVLLAGHHVRADLAALHEARAQARAELSDLVPATVIEELLEVLDAEQVRLVAAARGVHLIREALRGNRYVPRL